MDDVYHDYSQDNNGAEQWIDIIRCHDMTLPQNLPDLGEQLFHWWVDIAETLRSRVPSSALLAQASVIVEDARRYRELSAERGEPLSKCQLPSFSRDSRSATTWLCRWRKQFALHTPDGVQVQFAPHGSYRLPNVVDYLQWALDDPAAERETYTIVPVLDSYSAHFAEEVQEIVKLKTGSPVVYLGGGTTDVQAVCDVTAHHELSQIYKRMQAADQMR